MRITRWPAAATAGVITVAFIGACAGQVKQLEPKLALRTAAQHLAEEKQAGFTLKLTGDPNALFAAATKGEPAEDVKDDDDSLQKLFNSSATIAYDKGGDGPDDDRSSFSVTVDGIAGTELRTVGGMLYAKAPVAELARKFGQDDVTELRKQAVGTAEELGKLVDGQWVSMDLKAAQAAGQAGANVDSAKAAQELQTSAKNLIQDATVVRDKADDKHLVVTTTSTKAYGELKRAMNALAGPKGSELAEAMGKAPKERPIVLDLWLDHDKLTALELNVVQFADGVPGRAAVRIELTSGSVINAPEGATKIDPGKLGASFGAPADAVGTKAQVLGYQAIQLAEEKNGKPADYLKKAVAGARAAGIKARVVRSGVAEVTDGGSKACLTLPLTTFGEPEVVKGACQG